MLLRSGREAIVDIVRHVRTDTIVYNFAVDELRCYAVGEQQILVHNTNGGGPSSVLRVVEDGKPKFQLQKGEQGLSVFNADVVGPGDVLPSLRPGSRISPAQAQVIESQGLKILQTPGDVNLPPILFDNHWEILPGDGMTRNQFKQALRTLESFFQD